MDIGAIHRGNKSEMHLRVLKTQWLVIGSCLTHPARVSHMQSTTGTTRQGFRYTLDYTIANMVI